MFVRGKWARSNEAQIINKSVEKMCIYQEASNFEEKCASCQNCYLLCISTVFIVRTKPKNALSTKRIAITATAYR